MSSPSRPILAGLPLTQRADLASRLDLLIDRSGGPSACWPYMGGSIVGGYGTMWIGSGAKSRRKVGIHRLAYELANDGDSPPTIDHICHDPVTCTQRGPKDPHRLCANPAHLVAASREENAARGQRGAYREECRAGHRMTEENTYLSPTGARSCRRCAADRAADRRRDAYQRRNSLERPRGYRPRGLPPEQLVAWALEGQSADGCWTWPHGQHSGNGYMALRVDGKHTSAHRLVYKFAVGPIPDGFVVDHLCHDPQVCEGGDTCLHRACIRPDHLAAVSPERNLARDRVSRKVAVECVNGHAFTDENTYTDARGDAAHRNSSGVLTESPHLVTVSG